MKFPATKPAPFLLLAGFLFSLIACTPIYRTDYTYRQSYRHRRIAVVPPLVVRTDTTAAYGPGSLSALFQGGMYDWLEHRRYQYGQDTQTQDTDATIDRLEAAGYYEGATLSQAELAKLLDVDALLFTTLSINDRPRFSIWELRPVKRIDARMQLFDRSSGRVIWEYRPKLTVGAQRPLLPVLDRLAMRGSRYLPYYR